MRSGTALLGFILVTFLAPLASLRAQPDAWYWTLTKPAWTPPPWLFGLVWTLLYLAMAIAAWAVWKRTGFGKALAWWAGQLVLNAAWSPVFFGAHQPGWAFAVIVALWCAIVGTIVAFAKVQRWSAWLLAPYLAWVSFASALNFAIWQMND